MKLIVEQIRNEEMTFMFISTIFFLEGILSIYDISTALRTTYELQIDKEDELMNGEKDKEMKINITCIEEPVNV
jgi:hypothetical protein